jgi:hypothetical protein
VKAQHTLLSEGRIKYEYVVRAKGRIETHDVEREGPTGLIVTTTSLELHPENETRLVSVTVTDSAEQTKHVLKALARAAENDSEVRDTVDLKQWHALQTWLALGSSRVAVPFANDLAELVPPRAVRLRRDFKTLLMLIRAHALLHQASRQKDQAERIIAGLTDYAAVRELVADFVAAGVEATVPAEVRETVEAVRRLIVNGTPEVSQADLKSVLRLDKGPISRRVAAAIERNFLRNREPRKGRPARLVLADPLPVDEDVLPSVEVLSERLNGKRPPLARSRLNEVGRKGARSGVRHERTSPNERAGRGHLSPSRRRGSGA